jgi:hypothetical protein
MSDEKSTTKSDIKTVFLTYANIGKGKTKVDTMSNANFTKCITDSGLFNKKYTKNDVSLTFAAAKTKGKNVLTFEQFLDALALIGKKRYPTDDGDASVVKVWAKVGAATPKLTNTTKGKVSKSLEEKTGVYKRGGGSNKDKEQDLSGLTNRGVKTDARGVPTGEKEHL